MAVKRETFIRVNSRITKYQHIYIKDLAKKLNITEGEVHRKLVDFYIKNNK